MTRSTNRFMKAFPPAVLGLAFLGSAVSPSDPAGGESVSYTFQTAPVNSLGVKSMADLRGKPVLIDFWGTR